MDRDDLEAIHIRVHKDGVPVYLPYVYDPTRPGGKRWLGTFFDLGDAQRERDEARVQRRSDRGMKVGAFIKLFLRTDSWAPGTRDRYRSALRPLDVQFGDRYCDDISVIEARMWADGQPLGVTDVARTMFNAAIAAGVTTANPFANLRRKRSKGRSGIKTLTEEEVVALADLALLSWPEYGAVVRAMVLFAAYSGMRPAEIWALRWSDIRYASEEIRVEWQFVPLGAAKSREMAREYRRKDKELRVITGGVLIRPKNGEPRTIVLLDEAAEALRSIPRRLGSDYVFLTQRGTLFRKASWHRYWATTRTAFVATLAPDHWLRERMDARGQAGDLDFYELRHLCATLLLEAEPGSTDRSARAGLNGGPEPNVGVWLAGGRGRAAWWAVRAASEGGACACVSRGDRAQGGR